MDSRPSITWKKVWQLKVSQRVRVFAWLSMHEHLLTNVERVRSLVLATEIRPLDVVIARGNRLVEECRRAFYRLAAKGRGSMVLAIVFTMAPDDV
ncbi:hypothetical protein V6N13_015043 [Hibiscus sabdariffa]